MNGKEAAAKNGTTKSNNIKRHVTDHAIIDALTKNFGNISEAAKVLNVCRSNLSIRIHKSPTLEQSLTDSREITLDLAENQLVKAIERGESWAICFFLKCQGKGRGYIEKSEQEILNEKQLTDSMSDLAAAIRSTDG